MTIQLCSPKCHSSKMWLHGMYIYFWFFGLENEVVVNGCNKEYLQNTSFSEKLESVDSNFENHIGRWYYFLRFLLHLLNKMRRIHFWRSFYPNCSEIAFMKNGPYTKWSPGPTWSKPPHFGIQNEFWSHYVSFSDWF